MQKRCDRVRNMSHAGRSGEVFMTVGEFYVQRRKAERPLFMEVLNALPVGGIYGPSADAQPKTMAIGDRFVLRLNFGSIVFSVYPLCSSCLGVERLLNYYSSPRHGGRREIDTT